MPDSELTERFRRFAMGLRPEREVSGRMTRVYLRLAMHSVEREVRRLSAQGAGNGGAAEWLLDNWYLAKRCGEQICRGLGHKTAFRADRDGVTLPERLAQELLDAVPDLSEEKLAAALSAFQSELPLCQQELWNLIPAMQASLIFRLNQHCREGKGIGEDQGSDGGFGWIFSTLRTLETGDFKDLLESQSVVDRILEKDPVGAYAAMGDESKAAYRHRVIKLARENAMSESETAEAALALSAGADVEEKRHVGYYLFREPLGKQPPRRGGVCYAAAVLAVSALLAAAVGFWVKNPLTAPLLFFPVSDVVKNTLDYVLIRLARPRPLFGLELKEGIPPEGRTLCVITSLLTDEKSGDELAGKLERYCLANRRAGKELLFGLLCDLPDSRKPAGCAQRRAVESMRKRVEALNRGDPDRFYLFFREPSYHEGEGGYFGWERKRGALLSLSGLLRGEESDLKVLAGDPARLPGVRYVITLDSDTALSVDAAAALAGKMLHPLNRPVIDREKRVVMSGYGLLQPRIVTSLQDANRSRLSRIFSGAGGMDPYHSAASDVYHDLFDEGSYSGKGIFDVDAFLSCLENRFPEGRVLSHDLLEGAYLHAGCASDCVLFDSCPAGAASWFKRQNRWVRGDWQNLPWMLPRVENAWGEREKNPLTPLSRFKIFDNLRRSLSPACTMAVLVWGICFSGSVFAAALAAAVLSITSGLILTLADNAAHRGRGSHRRFHSQVVAGPGGAVLQTFVQFAFLPTLAWVQLCAAVTALWRMCVTRQNLLAWQTAAQLEAMSRGKKDFLCQMPAFIIGAAAFLLADLPFGDLVCLAWFLAPVLSLRLSRPERAVPAVSPRDRAFLLHEATLIWRYFTDFLRADDHYLPPDNFQEQPETGLAHRTSPTNIGLALLAAAAAADLELCPRDQAATLIGRMLTSVSALPKWNGHLYNWYNTRTCAPLTPEYVSTVDSGNLRACLLILRETLKEWGDEPLERMASGLAGGMDFSPLYDRKKKLFRIGLEVSTGKPSPGWYDLMASEARLTSFLAIAEGQAEPEHWEKLSRMLVGENRFCGMVSWTGTMFEYFMPNLFLPCEPGSMMYETLSFCVYAQKKRAYAAGVPWGCSESCFYLLDGSLNYQYKAHGVQRLGLKRGLDRELVVAPYASFLALLLAPRSACRNLRRLREMGLEGKYGLYEAVDFTPGRVPEKNGYMPVRCYMAHHLGMSLLAVDHLLRDEIMVRRLLRVPSVAAYRELLQERVPVSDYVEKNVFAEVPDRHQRQESPEKVRSGEWRPGQLPQSTVQSNSASFVFADSAGNIQWKSGEFDIVKSFPFTGYACAGVLFFLRLEGRLLPLQPVFSADEAAQYAWRFSAGRCTWFAAKNGVRAKLELRVPEKGCALEFRLTASADRAIKDAEIVCYLEPVLCRQRDYDAHPAFSRLFLTASCREGRAVFSRRDRNGGAGPELRVFWDRAGGFVMLSREKALGRGGLRHLEAALRNAPTQDRDYVPDPCLLLRFFAPLSRKEQKLTLNCAVGEDAELMARAGKGGREGGYLAALQRRCDLSGEEMAQLWACFSRFRRTVRFHRPHAPQEELWRNGISGDLPILLCEFSGEDEQELLLTQLKIHEFLRYCRFAFDLVLVIRDSGDYRRGLYHAAVEALHGMGAEESLGKPGGVHILAQTPEAVADWAALRLGAPEESVSENAGPGPLDVPSCPMRPEFGPAGEVRFPCGDRLPPLGWSQILASPEFGCLTDETGCGFLWRENARENQLLPWNNDPLAVGGGETVTAFFDGREVSLFGGDGMPCTASYGPGYARWDKKAGETSLSAEMFVPPEGRERLCLLSAGKPVEFRYCCGESSIRSDICKVILLVSYCGEDGQTLKSEFRPEADAGREKLGETRRFWADLTGGFQPDTPEKSLDRYLGAWALYQVIACRLYARTSRYQNGGAYGFRDQLQDACAVGLTHPEMLREQILRCCARQFEEGDVQHWWHPPTGKGVRTRISDDLVWLPYAAARFVDLTGDESLLLEEVPYLHSEVLRAEESERYEIPAVSQRRESVFLHAARALDCVLDRGTGPHGLLKIGAGDWNDGMNQVGARGKGESEWLTWFTALVLERFAPLCESRGDSGRAQRYLARGGELRRAAEGAWDGAWYLRGYYDSGRALGSARNSSCQIDSIAQSFAVFAGAGDGARRQSALHAAAARLYDKKNQLLRLFTPAFDRPEEDNPGYIAGYVPGTRENGGQYTHGAVWLAMAFLRENLPEEGMAMLRDLLPENHPPEKYLGEPYVLAGDVYDARGAVGRCGWSWYTGAAGWYFRAGAEELLGFHMRGGLLTVEPRVPASWPGFSVRFRRENFTLFVQAKRGRDRGMTLDGDPAKAVDLRALRGEHRLEVIF